MKSFIKNNSNFICKHCGFEVPIHESSSRDHCTECLWGLHVDVNPGDRLNNCRGLLEPISIITKNGKTQIEYKCIKCRQDVRCIVAPDDNFETLLSISNNFL